MITELIELNIMKILVISHFTELTSFKHGNAIFSNSSIKTPYLPILRLIGIVMRSCSLAKRPLTPALVTTSKPSLTPLFLTSSVIKPLTFTPSASKSEDIFLVRVVLPMPVKIFVQSNTYNWTSKINCK